MLTAEYADMSLSELVFDLVDLFSSVDLVRHLNEVTDDHREKFAEGNMWSYLQEQAKAAKNLAESAVDALAEESDDEEYAEKTSTDGETSSGLADFNITSALSTVADLIAPEDEGPDHNVKGEREGVDDDTSSLFREQARQLADELRRSIASNAELVTEKTSLRESLEHECEVVARLRSVQREGGARNDEAKYASLGEKLKTLVKKYKSLQQSRSNDREDFEVRLRNEAECVLELKRESEESKNAVEHAREEARALESLRSEYETSAKEIASLHTRLRQRDTDETSKMSDDAERANVALANATERAHEEARVVATLRNEHAERSKEAELAIAEAKERARASREEASDAVERAREEARTLESLRSEYETSAKEIASLQTQLRQRDTDETSKMSNAVERANEALANATERA
eukprot:g3638.t1